MIFDRLENCWRYEALHAHFAAAFAFLKKATEEQLPVGRYELDGENLFAMVQEYQTLAADKSRMEGHRRYIDIQYLIRGNEKIEVIPLSKGTPTVPYSEERDVGFFEDAESPVSLPIGAGEYAILWPEDLHKPGMMQGNAPTLVKKVVVKIRIS